MAQRVLCEFITRTKLIRKPAIIVPYCFEYVETRKNQVHLLKKRKGKQYDGTQITCNSTRQQLDGIDEKNKQTAVQTQDNMLQGFRRRAIKKSI